MKTQLIRISCFASALTALAGAAELSSQWAGERGITEGRLVKDSTSPDGKYALFEFNHWEGGISAGATTITGIGLAPVDRGALLFVIDSRTEWSTDKKVPSFLTYRWSADSKLLATHDSMSKHSRLSLYRLADGRATSLEVPDLLPIACASLGISASSVTSSGENPVRWTAPDTLQVSLRLTVKGRQSASSISLQVAADNSVTAKAAP
ncbi:MAG: hypothetical protein JWO82_3383 [Akkermansiaceae bacterium]|nr:hypothetical protein [Akkermansiaceae bacterium]